MNHITGTYRVARRTMDIIPYVMRVMAAEIRASEHAAAYSHVAILGMLLVRPHTLSDLAQNNSVSAPTMSSTINTLEERRWVRRRRDVEDRRVVWIEITPEGMDAVDAINHHTAQRIAHVLTTLTEDQLDTVIDGLNALRTAFSISMDESRTPPASPAPTLS